MDISVVIAAYNEEENVRQVFEKTNNVLKRLKKKYEIIIVDDGSTDNTFNELKKIKSDKLKIIKFRKNFGQTAAWKAGFDNAKGSIVITMDADMQNDPEDIPKLINKLNQGYDAVSGWRHKRKDKLSKRLFSGFSKVLRRLIINDTIHDSGCSLKAYKKKCIKGIELYGEMHRYIAEILSLQGYKIGEVKVNHFPRTKGKTKYNILRLPKGFLDLLIVAFWQKYSRRPIHLFGIFGIINTFIGIIIGIYLLYLKFMYKIAIANRPLLLLSALLILVGIQSIIFGLIADILIRIYYSGEKKPYNIEKIIP